MTAEQNGESTSSNRRRFVYGAFVALLVLAMPAATAYAQAAQTATATGTVTCKETHYENPTALVITTTVTSTYSIQWSLDDATIVGRWGTTEWGTSKDVVYNSAGATKGWVSASSFLVGNYPKNFSIYIYSLTDPHTNGDQLYSETGLLTFKVGKGNQMTITGTSFVVMDWLYTDPQNTNNAYQKLYAQCTWNLTGTFYPFF